MMLIVKGSYAVRASGMGCCYSAPSSRN